MSASVPVTPRRLALLILLPVAVAALDLGTKHWADVRLASDDHPLPAEVGASDVGTPRAAFLARAWSFASASAPDATSTR